MSGVIYTNNLFTTVQVTAAILERLDALEIYKFGIILVEDNGTTMAPITSDEGKING
jgi:hypothetical protein